VKKSGSGRVAGICGCPTVGGGIISAAGVKNKGTTKPAPYNHFAAGPDRGVARSGRGRVGEARGRPTVGAGIVSATGVHVPTQKISTPAPYDHLAASPHCRVTECSGRAGYAGCYPTVGTGIISPASI